MENSAFLKLSKVRRAYPVIWAIFLVINTLCEQLSTCVTSCRRRKQKTVNT